MTLQTKLALLRAKFEAVETPEERAIMRRTLEPIQEVAIQGQRAGLVKRRSMMRIMARRTKAAADRAYRSKSRARRRFRLIQASVRSTIQRLGRTTKRCSSLRLTISSVQVPVFARAAATVDPW